MKKVVHVDGRGTMVARPGRLLISYGVGPTSWGLCLVGWVGGSVCFLSFLDLEGEDSAVRDMVTLWAGAGFSQAAEEASKLLETIFLAKGRPGVLLKGTAFQISVWHALLQVGYGSTVSYQHLAKHLAGASYARAVGRAVGCNHVAYLVPCHRVVSRSGDLHGYRWGLGIKQRLLRWESQQALLNQDKQGLV